MGIAQLLGHIYVCVEAKNDQQGTKHSCVYLCITHLLLVQVKNTFVYLTRLDFAKSPTIAALHLPNPLTKST